MGAVVLPPRARAVGGGWRSARVGLRAEMGPLRKSISVRLEEGVPRAYAAKASEAVFLPVPWYVPSSTAGSRSRTRRGGDHRAARPRTGAAAWALRGGRRALRFQAYVARPWVPLLPLYSLRQ